MGGSSKASNRNNYLTSCGICRFGVYAGMPAVWQCGGSSLGIVHTECADGDITVAIDTARITAVNKYTVDHPSVR